MKAKYEYMLHVWGGFWNSSNIDIHKEAYVSHRWFDTKEERDYEYKRLISLAEKLGTWDSVIAHYESEGYLTRFKHVIRAYFRISDKLYISENDLGYGFFTDEQLSNNDDVIQYFKDYKYDYPDDVDFDENIKPIYVEFILVNDEEKQP